MLNVRALIIDTAKHVGDSWRKRYHHLVLHDSVWYDHLPYMPFPPTWPVFTPKDKLASWFEAYAETMELTIWNETTLQAAKWSDEKKSWMVSVSRCREGGQLEDVTFSVNVNYLYPARSYSTDDNSTSFKQQVPAASLSSHQISQVSHLSTARDSSTLLNSKAQLHRQTRARKPSS